jgi:serine/threonine protein kinase
MLHAYCRCAVATNCGHVHSRPPTHTLPPTLAPRHSIHESLARFALFVALQCEGPIDGFLVFELCDGGEMFQHLEPNSGLTPRSRIGVYFAQLVSAVVHVHACGLCHLDIKPENLLLGQNGVLKLADFGLSTLAEDGVVQVR